MSQLKKFLLASVLGVSSVFGGTAAACDNGNTRVVVIKSSTTTPLPPGIGELLGRLESLVQPVCQKVTVCNDQLNQAQSKVATLESKLVAATNEKSKAFQALKLLKSALEQPGCLVTIGNCSYSREAVAAAIEVKLAAHASHTTALNSLTNDLLLAQKTLEETKARVARWVAKEKELLAQIDQLQAEQTRQQAELSRVINDGNKLTAAIDQMLSGQQTAAVSVQSSNSAQLLAEVDQVLATK